MSNPLENAPCLYFTCDDKGIICEANEQLGNTLGYEKNTLTGQNVESIFTIATRIFYQTHFFPLLSMHGHAEEIYITLLTNSKEQVPVLINAKREEVNGKFINTYVGLVVQNRNKFEDELVRARNEAQHALHKNTLLIETQARLQQSLEELDQNLTRIKTQNEELEQFNHAVTHDLQEPIRKLTFFTSMLMDQHLNKTTIKSETIVPKIQQVVQKMSTIIQALQQHAWLRTAPLQLNEVNPADMISLLKKTLENEFGNDVLHIKAESIHPVIADKAQLQIALREVLSNAIRFRKSNEPVHIDIRIATVPYNQFTSLSGKYKFEKYSRIDITDNGTGFEPKFNEEIFSLFKRLHNNSGNGIGLSIAKKVVTNHQGKILADSKPGVGTTISFLLPERK